MTPERLKEIRYRAKVATGDAPYYEGWVVTYAEDVPVLLAEVEWLRTLSKAIHRWHLEGMPPSDDWVRSIVDGTYPETEPTRP